MESKQRALDLWEEATDRLREGDLEAAVQLYGKSIATCPTAEAHTFRGWAYSFERRYDDAIAECRRAIEVDPEFGNPYNDIGSYLIQMGQHDKAIPWLQMAKKAERYEPRHFPYLNLFRVYMKNGELDAAQREIEQAKFIQERQEMADGTFEEEDEGPPTIH